MTQLGIRGGEKLRALGPELRAAGPKVRGRLRKGLTASAVPITSEAKSGYRATYGQFGEELAAAITTKAITAGSKVGVSVRIAGAKLPEGKQGLPPLVEGLQAGWRHPLFGDPQHWYGQDPHPELALAVHRHLPGVQIAAVAAVDATAAELAHG